MANICQHGLHKQNEQIHEQQQYVNDPIGLLAAEIVACAVDDWRMLIKKKAWLPSVIASSSCNFGELRSFFNSQWCELLLHKCEIDPQRILQILEAELQEAKREYEKGKDGKK